MDTGPGMVETASESTANPDLVYVFDADGVVIKPWGFANALHAEFGITTKDTKDFFLGPFRSCLIGEADLFDALEPFLARWNWTASAQAFVDFWMQADDLPDAHVIAHIRKLRCQGARCYLASNQEKNRADYMRKQMNFDALFDQLFFSCDLGHMKPDKAFFDTVTSDLGAPPERIHFWDDASANVEAARDAHWNAYLYESNTSLWA